MSKRARFRDIKTELEEPKGEEERRAGVEEKASFRTSVLLRPSQKLALEEERLRFRREENKSVAVTDIIRQAIDDWLRRRRAGELKLPH